MGYDMFSHLVENWPVTVLILLGIAELATRLTKTKKDDAFIERVGKIIKSGLNVIGFPNRLK